MDQTDSMFIVCGMVRGPEAAQATCSKCAAVIWPTSGSLKRAQAQKIPMICTGCFQKIDDFEFGGFMHHGVLLPQEQSEKMFTAFELEMQKNRV